MQGFIARTIPLVAAPRGHDGAGARSCSPIGVEPDRALVLSQVVLSLRHPVRAGPAGAAHAAAATSWARWSTGAVTTASPRRRRRADHRAEPLPAATTPILGLSLPRPWPSPTPSSELVDSLPDDWTDLELDLRIFDEDALHRRGDLPGHVQRRSRTPSTTGTGGSSSPTASATPPRRPRSTARCKLLDEAGIDGELAVREVAHRAASRSSRCGAGRSPCARSSARISRQ